MTSYCPGREVELGDKERGEGQRVTHRAPDSNNNIISTISEKSTSHYHQASSPKFTLCFFSNIILSKIDTFNVLKKT